MIDLIPKQTFAYPRKTALFFYGALFLLLLVVAGFFVLKVLQGRTTAEIANLTEQLSRQKTAQELKLEQTVLGYEQKLKDFSSLATLRTNALPVFEFLEANTHPAVFFTNLTFTAKERKLSLVGEALDFKSLDQQLAVLKVNEKVVSATISDIALGEKGRPTFQLVLVFKESLFQ